MADPEKVAEYIAEVCRLTIGRQPSQDVLDRIAADIATSGDPIPFLLSTAGSEEAQQRSARLEAGALFVPPGHFYSPVVDRTEAERYLGRFPATQASSGVAIDFDAMRSLFERMMGNWSGIDFPAQPSAEYRYYSENDLYNFADASVLSALLQYRRPKRWIEVGSGFTSAALLDTLDRTPGLQPELTFIEPYPERLEGLLKQGDSARAKIIRSGVQEVPLEVFDDLEAGDVLFLDTTHVSKTGSDVNHEIFFILPRLKSGVMVHFHDVFDGFEYPAQWAVQENRSWNEIYLIRAFLMFNAQFRVVYADHAFAVHCPDAVAGRDPRAVANPGAGLWIERL